MMLDYDGTLTPIVSQPDQAQIGQEGIDLLKRVATNPRYNLAIVSGRSVEQLQHFLKDLKDLPIMLCGLHGGQVYDVQKEQFLRQPTLENAQAIETLYQNVKGLEQKYPGVLLENKKYGLALHYRNVADESTAEKALAEFNAAIETQGLLSDFHLKPGKKVLELAPKICNKGNAVTYLSELLNRDSEKPHFPVYFGDDLTDEDAFKAVNQAGGVSGCLGQPEQPTSAKYNLTDYKSLYQVLAGT